MLFFCFQHQMFSQGENDCHQRPILPRKTRTGPRSPRIQPNAQLKNKTASKSIKAPNSPIPITDIEELDCHRNSAPFPQQEASYGAVHSMSKIDKAFSPDCQNQRHRSCCPNSCGTRNRNFERLEKRKILQKDSAGDTSPAKATRYHASKHPLQMPQKSPAIAPKT